MADFSSPSRREFLSTSAKAAAAAGLTLGGCAAGGEKLKVVSGPKPARVEPGQTMRIGWIGSGGRGRRLMGYLLEQPNVMVTAIADPNDANRQKGVEMVKKAGNTPEEYRGEEDYRKLLARDDIDAVFIAVPVYLHGKFYLDAFAAGKHFYGEKPLCDSAAEANALVRAQEKNPELVAQIGFQRRADEVYQKGIQAIREGAIGDLIGGYGAWNNWWGPLGLPDQGTAIWYGRREMSGDWMLEQACHTWDVFNWVSGQLPVAASGMGRENMFPEIDPDRNVTDFYFANLEYPDDFLVDFEHSWVSPHSKFDKNNLFNGIFERVIGPKGGIALNDGHLYPRSADGEMVKWAEHYKDATPQSVALFVQTVREGRKPVSDVHNGRMATMTGLLVRKAVDERRKVTMDEILA
jgi:predicted dehydrogenase